MHWKSLFNDYLIYLKVERGLSVNTTQAYTHDLERYLTFLEQPSACIATEVQAPETPQHITLDHLQTFLIYLAEACKINEFSMARNIAAVRSFHSYLELTEVTTNNVAQLIDLPKLNSKLPDILTVEEIHALISACNTQDDLGIRNRAITETLYSSGLRVSELINLRLPHLYFNEGFIRVIGKGDKERLVPIGAMALEYINLYLDKVRSLLSPKKGSENIVFLNRRGAQLTREMIFVIVKNLAETAGINKSVSPHTFRHSFATHLIEAGADLIAVRDLLGHASVSTTEVYLHTDVEHLRRVVETYHPRKK